MAYVDSVNAGKPVPNPYKDVVDTGIAKRPQSGAIEVRAPGPKTTGLGSGVVGDFIGDRLHHGGDDQAVYAFAREDLDRWEQHLGRSLDNGTFGENLTTVGLDLSSSLMGEVWRVGTAVELMVTYPRIPCSTFRGWMHEVGWLKTFTADGRPGAYLRVLTPGHINAGDPIEVRSVPQHGVTIATAFRALTTERDLLPRYLVAEEYLQNRAATSG